MTAGPTASSEAGGRFGGRRLAVCLLVAVVGFALGRASPLRALEERLWGALPAAGGVMSPAIVPVELGEPWRSGRASFVDCQALARLLGAIDDRQGAVVLDVFGGCGGHLCACTDGERLDPVAEALKRLGDRSAVTLYARGEPHPLGLRSGFAEVSTVLGMVTSVRLSSAGGEQALGLMAAEMTGRKVARPDGHLRLRFRRPQGPLDVGKLESLLRVRPSVEGTVFVIGIDDPSDRKPTPLGEMPGYQVHAHVADTLLSGRHGRPLTPVEVLLLLTALAAAAMGAFSRWSGWRARVASVGVGVAWATTAGVVIVMSGVELPLVAGFAVLVLGAWAGALSELGRRRQRARRLLRDLGSAPAARDTLDSASLPTRMLNWLPRPLAVQYFRGRALADVYARLNADIELFESTVRYTTCLLLADAAHRGPAPAWITRIVRDRLRRPTTGEWVGALRAMILTRGVPVEDGELLPLFREALRTSRKRTALDQPLEDLRTLRNRLKHFAAATTPRSTLERAAAEAQAAIETLFSSLTLLEDVELFRVLHVREAGGRWQTTLLPAMGLGAIPETRTFDRRLTPGRMYVGRTAGTTPISLWPMLLYDACTAHEVDEYLMFSHGLFGSNGEAGWQGLGLDCAPSAPPTALDLADFRAKWRSL